MAEPIQQRRGQLLILKDLDSFTKGEIARDHRRALAVALGQDVKEQFAPSALKGDKTEFIYDQEIHFDQTLLEAP